MSRFAKAFHLTCAIVGTFTCVLWSVIAGALVFYRREMSPRHDPAKFVFLLIPALVVGAGAVMEFSFYKGEREGRSSNEDESLVGSGGFALITTRPRALAAIALTVWMLVAGLRSLSYRLQPYSMIWLFSGLLPHWVVVLATIAFYGAFMWIAGNITSGSLRKEEKVLMFALFAVPLLAPVGVLLPETTSSLRLLQTFLELTALLASISILLSLHKLADDKPREGDNI